MTRPACQHASDIPEPDSGHPLLRSLGPSPMGPLLQLKDVMTSGTGLSLRGLNFSSAGPLLQGLIFLSAFFPPPPALWVGPDP